MLILRIDSTQKKNKSIELVKNVDSKDVCLAHASGDFDTVSKIKELLDEQNLKPQDFTEVQYRQGSGSFTGIKNSAAVANVINWVNGAELSRIPPPKYPGDPNIQNSGETRASNYRPNKIGGKIQ